MIYLDTSVVVSALTTEALSTASRRWIAAQEPGTLAISLWVATEFHSAIGVKVRSRQISRENGLAAAEAFSQLVDKHCVTLLIVDSSYAAASAFLRKIELGLRAGDALHIAIAQAHDVAICTMDRRMYDAAMSFGSQAELLA
ncbi:MAG: type II toxin-antitoxin system VapC family toxin [Beijerinckiaceae bacterium]